MDADRYSLDGLPLDADCSANLDDLVSFLEGQTDDLKIEQYLWSAILVRRPSTPMPLRVDDPGRSPVSRAYCALKLLFLSSSTALRSEADGKPIRPDPTILAHLRAGNVIQALGMTARRLRVSGYVPIPGPLSGGKARAMECAERVNPIRLAAALLIPIQARDTGELKRTALREKSA
jgi:CRISPR-associated protein Csx17